MLAPTMPTHRVVEGEGAATDVGHDDTSGDRMRGTHRDRVQDTVGPSRSDNESRYPDRLRREHWRGGTPESLTTWITLQKSKQGSRTNFWEGACRVRL
jgi:hypothetical protein